MKNTKSADTWLFPELLRCVQFHILHISKIVKGVLGELRFLVVCAEIRQLVEVVTLIFALLVPYRWNRGDYRFPPRLSVCPSVRPSTWCLSTRFLCRLRSIAAHRDNFVRSKLFSVVLWDIDLKFGIWICHDIIQIKFDFCRVWPTFSWVITLYKNLPFRTFLSCLLWYWPEIWYMNLSWHNTDQVRLLSRLTYFYMSYCPLLKFRFPDFSLSTLDILTWNLIYEFVLT